MTHLQQSATYSEWPTQGHIQAWGPIALITNALAVVCVQALAKLALASDDGLRIHLYEFFQHLLARSGGQVPPNDMFPLTQAPELLDGGSPRLAIRVSTP